MSAARAATEGKCEAVKAMREAIHSATSDRLRELNP